MSIAMPTVWKLLAATWCPSSNSAALVDGERYPEITS
jgi:hypothetical protein